MTTLVTKRCISLALVATLVPVVANAEDTCDARGVAEQVEIEREFSRNRPPSGDKDAELAWAKNLDSALAAAANRAEDCSRANKKATGPTAAQNEQQCAAKASQQADELDKKYRGRTLSAEEQAARRSEENRLLEERMACMRNVQR